MKPPLCRVCQSEHWPKAAHVWAGARLVVNEPVVVNNPVVVVNTASNVVVNKRSLDRHNKDARRAYMREYMKRRRAKIAGGDAASA